jgi:hypothetical protein
MGGGTTDGRQRPLVARDGGINVNGRMAYENEGGKHEKSVSEIGDWRQEI